MAHECSDTQREHIISNLIEEIETDCLDKDDFVEFITAIGLPKVIEFRKKITPSHDT